MSKRCCTCREVKAAGEFHRDSHRPDGLQNKCKVCRSAAAKPYRKRTLQHRKRYHQDWVTANKEHWLEYQRAWRATRGKQTGYNNRYRGSKVLALGNFTGEEFKWLCIDYNQQCLDCGSYDKPLTADHVIPLSKGGDNNIKNIQPLCGSCNSRKGAKTIDYRTKIPA